MGRPAWRFQTCGPCRKRKVKCGSEFPECTRCRTAGRTCEGYYVKGSLASPSGRKRPGVGSHVSATPKTNIPRFYKDRRKLQARIDLDAPLTDPQIREQLLASFIATYIPEGSIQHHSPRKTVFSWYEDLPNIHGHDSILDMALYTLSTGFFGGKLGDYHLLKESQKLRSLVVEKITRLTPSETNSLGEDLICTAMVMTVYEVITCPDGRFDGWMVHIRGGCRLLQCRGPPTPNRPISRTLYRRLRIFAFYEACAARQATFLDHPEWHATTQKQETLDELLNILLGIPSILEMIDQVSCSVDVLGAASTRQRLNRRIDEVQSQLLDWYWRVQNQEGRANLFVIESIIAPGLTLLEDEPELVGTFSGGVIFSNHYNFELIMLYWFGCITMYTSMARAYKQLYPSVVERALRLAGLSSNMTSEGFDVLGGIERTADQFATRACQAIAFCERSAIGYAGFQLMLPSLWAAQQFFYGQSARKVRWCQMIHKGLQKKGLMFGNVIATVTQQQYADRVKELPHCTALKSTYLSGRYRQPSLMQRKRASGGQQEKGPQDPQKQK